MAITKTPPTMDPAEQAKKKLGQQTPPIFQGKPEPETQVIPGQGIPGQGIPSPGRPPVGGGPDGSPEVIAAQQALQSKLGRPQLSKSDPRYGRSGVPSRRMPDPSMNRDPRIGRPAPQMQGSPMPAQMPAIYQPPQFTSDASSVGGRSFDRKPSLGMGTPTPYQNMNDAQRAEQEPSLDQGPAPSTGQPIGQPVGAGGRMAPPPGMERRPRGGMRPIRGMQGAPQDGGMQQFDPQQQMNEYNTAINNMSPEIRAQYDQLQGRMPSMVNGAGQGAWANQQSQGQMDPRQQYFKQLSGLQ